VSTQDVSGDISSVRRRRRDRRIALAVVLGLIIGAALLTPEAIGGRSGDPRLTTYSASPQGARLMYELAARLGWRVERWTNQGPAPADAQTVIALLDPAQPLSALEAHRLLEQVRGGAGLLYVVSGNSPLNDSLHVKRTFIGGSYESTNAGTADAPAAATSVNPARARHFDSTGSASASPAGDESEEASAECAHALPNGSVMEMQPRDTSLRPSSPAAAGFPFGRGRVAVLSDPDFLRNDVLRVCKWGLDVVAVRILEFLAAGDGRRDRLVFDEYHQGFGTHPGTLRAIVVYLSRSASGHVLLQCMAAGLLLLLALGPRSLPAHDPERVERRSPLEHVSALAQAYSRVGGTRTATARLLRGLRRRAERGMPNEIARMADDRDRHFLEMLAATPRLAEDAALIRRALTESLDPGQFPSVGAALQRVEQSLLTARR
jgi:hypothetical protein